MFVRLLVRPFQWLLRQMNFMRTTTGGKRVQTQVEKVKEKRCQDTTGFRSSFTISDAWKEKQSSASSKDYFSLEVLIKTVDALLKMIAFFLFFIDDA